MKIELDIENNFVEATDFVFYKKVADILLGVQRGVDVYFRFKSKNGSQINERCFHFSGVTTPWSDEKCFEKVMEKINQGGVIKTQINYPPKTEELI